MKTTLRINTIVELLPTVDTLIDVGCDHGYIGVNALLSHKAKSVIFTDISMPSLKKAQRLAHKKGVDQKSLFLCGDGLCGKRADCAVLAGMGGKEIIKILQSTPILPKTLILNPMKGVEETRRVLQKFYNFEVDKVFFDKKFYWIMKLNQGTDDLSEMQFKYGKTNLEYFSEDFCHYLFEEKQKCVTILNNANCQAVQQRLEQIEILLKRKDIC